MPLLNPSFPDQGGSGSSCISGRFQIISQVNVGMFHCQHCYNIMIYYVYIYIYIYLKSTHIYTLYKVILFNSRHSYIHIHVHLLWSNISFYTISKACAWHLWHRPSPTCSCRGSNHLHSWSWTRWMPRREPREIYLDGASGGRDEGYLSFISIDLCNLI